MTAIMVSTFLALTSISRFGHVEYFAKLGVCHIAKVSLKFVFKDVVSLEEEYACVLVPVYFQKFVSYCTLHLELGII